MFYIIRQGFANIWKNKLFSLASIATMTACIFLFGVFYSIGANFREMVATAEEGVSITVLFDVGISQEQIEIIGAQIGGRPEVSEYRFISAEEAWEDYKKVYFEGREEMAAGFEGNPLANSASYEVKLNDVSMQHDLAVFIEGLEGVRQVNQSEAAARTLTDFNSLLTFIFIGIIIILVAVAIFLISNTVATGITVRREEITIMKLIGAKDSFVRAPFIVEGVIIGIIGALLPMALLYFLYGGIIAYVSEKFNALQSLFTFLPVEEIFTILAPVSLVLGVGIGFIGSRFTVRRHLSA